MGEFHSEKADVVLAACQTGVEDVGAALSRAFDGEYAATAPSEFEEYSPQNPPTELDGAGLAIELKIEEDSSALVLLPEASNLLPRWCDNASDSDKAQLLTLAKELGGLLLPDNFEPVDQRATYVKNLRAFCLSATLTNATLIRMAVKDESAAGDLLLLWPASRFDVLAGAESAREEAAVDEEIPAPPAEGASINAEAPQEPAAASRTRVLEYKDLDEGLRLLPSYARSLLKVRVPVRVILASTQMPLEQVRELGTGSIIQFQKSCDETLSLEVGGLQVAAGEAVKVGDKFGLWITAITMPQESFEPIGREHSG